MANSTRAKSRRKSTTKRKKPSPDFPLFHHHSGRWCKKVRPIGDAETGIRPKPKFHYFGRVADDPQGVKALGLWREQKDDLLAGKTPRTADGSPTIGFLCNEFVAAKKLKVETGEMAERTYADYYATCELLGKKLGFKTPLNQLKPGDFTTLRASMAKGTRKKWSAVRLGNEIQRIRTVFKWGLDAVILDRPIKFGPEFKKPARKEIRKARKARGLRMIEAADVRRLLWKSDIPLKAMILLAVNCGLGNSDVGNLPLSAIDLDGGWLNYPRPKTGIDRRCKLWLETVKRLRRAIAERPAPKDPAHRGLVFITKYGGPWAKSVADSPVTKEFRKLLDELKLHRPGLGFYTLRHVFETIAGESRDQVAVDHVMGHARDDMASVYRERISDERLVAVTEHVPRVAFCEGRKCRMTPDELAANAERLQRHAAFVRGYATTGAEDRTAVSPEYRQRKAQLTAEFTSDLAAEAVEVFAAMAPVVSQNVGNHERPNDGPVSPDGFRYHGEVYRGLQPSPWRLLAFLWAQPDRATDLDDAVAYVMDQQVYEDEPHGWRKRLNEFFRMYGLPFHATIRKKARQAAIMDGLPAKTPRNGSGRLKKPTERP